MLKQRTVVNINKLQNMINKTQTNQEAANNNSFNLLTQA